MSKLSNGKAHLPLKLADRGLNLRAFVDLPPPGASLEQEVAALVHAARVRTMPPEAVTRAIIGIIGRETDRLEDAVRRALSPGELWAEGCKEDLQG
ncbi:MAG: hypothetical protein K2X87_09385 [Gemmataceae bacterium]|nr:hypothetical protein [Gemmataceae bacterium]